MISKISTTAFAALVFFGVAAHGAIVSFSQPFGPTAVGTPSITRVLQKFDPTLGTLTAVTLTLSATNAGSSLAFDNEAVVPGTVTLQIGVSLTASAGSGPVLMVATNPVTSGSSPVAGDEPADGSGDFLGADSFRIQGGGSDSDSTTQTLPAYLTQFTSTGPADTTFLTTISNAIFTSATTSGIFGPTLPAGGTYAGTVTVAYTYLLVPVPEAGTVLWGACLAAVAAFRRTRVRRA